MGMNTLPISWLKKCPIGKKIGTQECMGCDFREGAACNTSKAMDGKASVKRRRMTLDDKQEV